MAEINITVTEESAVGVYVELAKVARDEAVAANADAQTAMGTAEIAAAAALQSEQYVANVLADNITLPYRMNLLENSSAPAFLGNNDGVADYGGCKCYQIADTFSPFRYWGLGYIRAISSYSQTNGICLLNSPSGIPIGTQAARPTRIELGFWVNDTNLKATFPTYPFGFYLFDAATLLSLTSLSTFIDTEGASLSGNITASASVPVSAYSWQAEVVKKYLGWTKVVIRITSITWKSVSNTTASFQINLNNRNSLLFGKDLYFSNIEITHNYTHPSGTLYNLPSMDGNGKYPIFFEDRFGIAEKAITDLQIASSATDLRLNAISPIQTKNTCKYVSGALYMRSYYNATYDIVISMNTAYIQNFARLILKADDITASGILLNIGSDDQSPVFIQGLSAIGGGHGFAYCYEVTSAAHGKALNDVGSEWVDTAGFHHIITEIVSTSVFRTISLNYGDSVEYLFKTPTGTLTHVTGAQHTTAVPVTSTAGYQLPSRKNETVMVLADGVALNESANTFTAYELALINTYEIADPISTITKIVANKPTNGYTTQPSLVQGDPIFKMINKFILKDGASTFIEPEIEFYKVVKLIYFSGTQVGFLNPIKTVGNGLYDSGVSQSYKRYMPKCLPLDLGYGGNSDFRLGVAIDADYANTYYLDSSKWESPTTPPDRCFDILKNTSTFKACFSIDYLPYGFGGANKLNNATNAWYIFPTRKNYPIAVDDKIHVGGVIPIGTYKQGVILRKWTNVLGINQTQLHYVDRSDCSYLYVDYHAAMTDVITVPTKYKGRRIEVIEKSANVTVMTDLVTDTIRLMVAIASPMYGYAVLKLK